MRKLKSYFLTAFILLFTFCISFGVSAEITQRKYFSSIPRERIKEMGDIEGLVDDKLEDFTVHTVRSFNEGELKYNDKSIPVLYYHSIGYEKGNDLRIPRDNFRKQMKYLSDNRYTTLTLDELYSFFKNNKPIPEKSVVITFDDGYKDNYIEAYPIMKEYGIKATVFVVTSWIDNINLPYMTSQQLREMEASGIAIESHTVNHDDLSKMSYNKQLNILRQSKESLEKILHKEIKYIAYPFGYYNNDSIKAAKEAGYSMAFTINKGWSNKSNGLYSLNRVFVGASTSIDEFKNKISSKKLP